MPIRRFARDHTGRTTEFTTVQRIFRHRAGTAPSTRFLIQHTRSGSQRESRCARFARPASFAQRTRGTVGCFALAFASRFETAFDFIIGRTSVASVSVFFAILAILRFFFTCRRIRIHTKTSSRYPAQPRFRLL